MAEFFPHQPRKGLVERRSPNELILQGQLRELRRERDALCAEVAAITELNDLRTQLVVHQQCQIKQLEAERHEFYEALSDIRHISGLANDESNGWNAQQRNRLNEIHRCAERALSGKKQYSYLREENTDLRAQLAAALERERGLRELVDEAHTLIIARGESTDVPLQFRQHAWLKASADLPDAARHGGEGTIHAE